MNREQIQKGVEVDKQRVGGAITGGLILVGLGLLAMTGWWWPGIMIVLGVAVGSGLLLRGRYMAAAITSGVFFGIPILTKANVQWHVFGPMILIGLGASILVKAFLR